MHMARERFRTIWFLSLVPKSGKRVLTEVSKNIFVQGIQSSQSIVLTVQCEYREDSILLLANTKHFDFQQPTTRLNSLIIPPPLYFSQSCQLYNHRPPMQWNQCSKHLTNPNPLLPYRGLTLPVPLPSSLHSHNSPHPKSISCTLSRISKPASCILAPMNLSLSSMSASAPITIKLLAGVRGTHALTKLIMSSHTASHSLRR